MRVECAFSHLKQHTHTRTHTHTVNFFPTAVTDLQICCYRPAASSVHYTTSCKHSVVLLKMGEIIARNMLI